MAGYVAGTATVHILPDLSRAQLAISAFFEKQKDEIRVPVKPDIDEKTVRESGRRIGKQLGDAISSEMGNAGRSVDQEFANLTRVMEARANEAFNNIGKSEQELGRQREALHAEALRMDRDRGLSEKQLLAMRERAHAEALRMDAQLARETKKNADAQIREQARVERETGQSMQRMLREAARQAERDKVKIQVDQKQAEDEARKWSGGFTQALEREFYQRRVFISSVLAGGLAAGGPAILAATSGLFAGLGAVAVSSSNEVRQAWTGAWHEIKSGATADAAVLVPVYSQMADRIGQAFQDMRPLLRSAFEAVGPQIETVTTGLISMGNSALPGMVRGLQNAGPAIEGLANGMARIGEGLNEFFTTLGDNSGQFGHFFEGLGEAVADILPLLAEMSGTAAEVGGTILPLIGTAARSATGLLRGFDSVLGSVGSSLTQVIAGFIAFRVAQNAAAGFARVASSIGGKLMDISAAAGSSGSNIGKFGNTLSGIARMAPLIGSVLGILAGGIVMAFQQSEESARKNAETFQKWFATIRAGGPAADELSAGLERLSRNDMLNAVVEKHVDLEEKRRENMTRSARAAEDLEGAESRLQFAIEQHGAGSSEAEAASRDYADALREDAAAAAEAERAISGVTEAMAEQGEQARSRVDAEFAYQKSLLDQQKALGKVADAQQALNDVRNDPGASAEDIALAERDLAEAFLDGNMALGDRVQAARDLAAADLPAQLDDHQRAVLSDAAALAELNKIAAEFPLPPELEQYRQSLIAQQSGADAAVLAQAQLITSLSEVGVAAAAVPGTIAVAIDADTPGIDGLLGTLEDLGFTIHEVDGEFRISAQTDEAQENIGRLSELLAPYLNGQNVPDPIPIEVDPTQAEEALGYTETELQEFANVPRTARINIEVDGSASEQIGQVGESLANLPDGEEITVEALTDDAIDGLKTLGFTVEENTEDGTVTVSAETDAAKQALEALRGNIEGIDNFVAEPSVGADTSEFDGKAQGVLGSIYSMDELMAIPAADLDIDQFTGVEAGLKQRIAFLNAQRPTPVADMDSGPLGGKVSGALSQIAGLAKQKAIPIGDLNIAPFQGQVNTASKRLQGLSDQRATPVVSVIDNASGVISSIQARLNGLTDRTVSVTTVQKTKVAAAMGGIFATAFADGGFQPNMRGGMAQIVPPNTWRIIGDRVVDDEAYIPINDSARSAALLRETAMRMGYDLAAMADGGTMSVPDGIRRMVSAGDNVSASEMTPMSIAGMNVQGDAIFTDNAETVMRAADSSKRRTLVELGIV